MARNIEIKAKAHNFPQQSQRALNMADGGPEHIDQEDVFFPCTRGRLKLRKFADGSGELIAYERPDCSGPKVSDYTRTPIQDAAALEQCLTRALGVLGVVKKRRTLLRCGQTRIHLDNVENLGHFIELEVVLRTNQTPEDGQRIAQEIMAKCNIPSQDLIACAYIDLLQQRP